MTLAPVRLGPSAVPPESRTLAWKALEWADKYLLQPDGPKAGEPWEFTPEQVRFLLNWYAIDDNGRFVYRSGMFRRMKGHGKDPLAAALCMIEFVGPCRFDGWSDGSPLVTSHPAAWVQAAAVSREQTRNLMTIFPAMISQRAIEEYGIDMGKEIIYAERGRKRIEAVTSSPRALEGGRATFIVKDESHHWIASNEGHEMSKVIARNAAKSRDGSSRVLAISNAHAPGEDSDAEHDLEAYKKIEQGLAPLDMLYDSVEAPETDLNDDESLRAGLIAAIGDSHWLDVDRLMAEIHDPRTSPAMARRFYLNQIVAEEDKPFDAAKFRTLAKPHKVPDGEVITLGFDGSLTRDHTALIGTEIKTGYQWVVGYWEPEMMGDGEMRIDFRAVDETVDDAFRRWDVWRMNADPYKWGTWISAWAGRYGEKIVVSWSTTLYRKMAAAVLAYRTAIASGDVSYDGDRRFAAAVANAYKHVQQFRDDDGEQMFTIQKERPDSPLKIDAVVAAVLSWEARQAAVAAGVLDQGEVGVMFIGR